MSMDRVRVKGISIHRPIIYGNTSVVLTPEEVAQLPEPALGERQHTHRWTVAVRSAASAEGANQVGGADDISSFIKKVNFKIWHGYPNPSRTIETPPFEISETGWGEFEVQIRIMFVQESGEKPILINHFLKIHPWTIDLRDVGRDWLSEKDLEEARRLGPVHSWQYDEIVFNDPYQGFLDKLLQHPPTPLPKTRRRPIPFHTANPTPADFEASRAGGMPEFTLEMAKQEEARLMAAVDAVIAEQDRWQNTLADRERELEMLRQQLGED